MRDLNDEYNSMHPSEAVDGYEYPTLDNQTAPRDQFYQRESPIVTQPLRVNPAQFQRDLLDALIVLAFHCKRTTDDTEAHAEINYAIERVERHLR